MSADELDLRRAVADDARRVFDWANDPVTRAASFVSREIAWEEHAAWFARSLEAPDRVLFIALRAGEPAGLVRFDRNREAGEGWEAATIGINVAPSQRGGGFGTALLLRATRAAEELGIRTIFAAIKRENAASLRAFEKAGYVRVGDYADAGVPALLYRLEVGGDAVSGGSPAP